MINFIFYSISRSYSTYLLPVVQRGGGKDWGNTKVALMWLSVVLSFRVPDPKSQASGGGGPQTTNRFSFFQCRHPRNMVCFWYLMNDTSPVPYHILVVHLVIATVWLDIDVAHGLWRRDRTVWPLYSMYSMYSTVLYRTGGLDMCLFYSFRIYSMSFILLSRERKTPKELLT